MVAHTVLSLAFCAHFHTRGPGPRGDLQFSPGAGSRPPSTQMAAWRGQETLPGTGVWSAWRGRPLTGLPTSWVQLVACTLPGRSSFRSLGRGHTVRWCHRHAFCSARAPSCLSSSEPGTRWRRSLWGAENTRGPASGICTQPSAQSRRPEARLVEGIMTSKSAENMHSRAALCQAGRFLRSTLPRKTIKTPDKTK